MSDVFDRGELVETLLIALAMREDWNENQLMDALALFVAVKAKDSSDILGVHSAETMVIYFTGRVYRYMKSLKEVDYFKHGESAN